MAVVPYMPLYVADYMADAGHLSTLEHGAYLLLIMAYWQRQKPLPASNERLANLAHMSPEGWREVRAAIAPFFQEINGTWLHKRVETELLHFRDKSDKSRKAGIASGEKRRNRRSTSVERTFSERSPETNGRSTDVESKFPEWENFSNRDTSANGRSTDVQRTVNHTDADEDGIEVLRKQEVLLTPGVFKPDPSKTDGGVTKRKKGESRLNGTGLHPVPSQSPSVPNPQAENFDPQKIDRMAATLHAYMEMSGTAHKRQFKAPDTEIVKRCLAVVNGASLDEVSQFLHDRYANYEQSPRHAKGPKKYAWFETVLKSRFSPNGAHA